MPPLWKRSFLDLCHWYTVLHAQCVAAISTQREWREEPPESRKILESRFLFGAPNVATINEILKHASSTAVDSMVQSRQSDTGHSVLHHAVKMGRPVQVICKLLKLGAHPAWKDNTEQTAADVARAAGQTLIAQLLDRAAQDTQAKAGTA